MMAVNLALINASDTTGEAVQANLTAARPAGSTTFTVDSTAHWPAYFIATSGTVQTDNTLNPATTLVFLGHLSSGKIIIDTLAPGYTDTLGNSINDVVVIKPTTAWADGMQAALQVSHNNDGTLKNSIVTYASLLTTIFSSQITSTTNTDTAAGTINTLNLGGVKLAWGITGTLSFSNGGGALFYVTLPSGFFTSIQGLGAWIVSQTGVGTQISPIDNYTTSRINLKVGNIQNGSGTCTVSWFIIGS